MFKAYCYVDLFSKAFLLVSAQRNNDEIDAEYFFILEDADKKVHTGGLFLNYPPNVLSLMNWPDPVQTCFDSAVEQGGCAISLKFLAKYYKDLPDASQGVDVRYDFVKDRFKLGETNSVTVARFIPDAKYIEFVHQSKNQELKSFAEAAFLINKGVRTNNVSSL